jgi:putative component of membrane protein insertase Oxa1/YidC/SpoIIIJ protein YidD
MRDAIPACVMAAVAALMVAPSVAHHVMLPCSAWWLLSVRRQRATIGMWRPWLRVAWCRAWANGVVSTAAPFVGVVNGTRPSLSPREWRCTRGQDAV